MPMHSAIESFADAKLDQLSKKKIKRDLKPTARIDGGAATRAGQHLVSFCDNDYLGLSNDPRLRKAASAAAISHGAGAGASRLVTGDHPLNHQVEIQIAKMKGFPAARIFGSGYLANLGTIPVLVGRNDRIIMDELSHSCMHAGAQLSGAQIVLYRHNNTGHLAELLDQGRADQRQLVLTETVFSMDGDRAPLDEIFEICETYDAWLMTDDAHGFGLPGNENRAPIQMGTFSKSAGSYGGYVCASPALVELLISRARSFVYTTGLPPAVLAATLEALDIIEAEPERGQRALSLAALFCDRMGLPEPQSAIVPILCGDEARALTCSAALQSQGLLVTAIRPPTVPVGTARLRVTFSAAHQEDDVERLAGALLALNVPA